MAVDETSTAGVPAAGVDYLRADATSHRIKQSLNGGAEVNVPIPSEIPAAQVAANLASSGSTGVTGVLPVANGGTGSTVANTTFTTSTSSVSANTCNSTVQVAMTGVTTSMTFGVTASADTSGATGWGSTGGLILDVWPTSGYLNYKICNQTTATISSPGAVTFNASAR
jgi:hypothetical protein